MRKIEVMVYTYLIDILGTPFKSVSLYLPKTKYQPLIYTLLQIETNKMK